MKNFKKNYTEEDLIGCGLIDWITSPIQETKKLFSIKKEFNNGSKKTMGQFGNFPVVSLKLMRTPIVKLLDTLINLISLGKFQEAKDKYGYDDLYHLALVCTVKLPNDSTKDIICEKNEVVNISTSFDINDKTETLNVPIGERKFTVNSLLEDTLKREGIDDFFLYDALKNNCQFFISRLLQTLKLYNMTTRNFLFQNPIGLAQEIDKTNPFTSKILKGLTNLGALFSKWTGQGQGKRKFKLTKKDLKLLEEMESHFSKMKGGAGIASDAPNLIPSILPEIVKPKKGKKILTRKEEEEKAQIAKERAKLAKQKAQAMTKKQSQAAKKYNVSEREKNKSETESNAKNAKEQNEREKKEDADLLKKIDPMAPNRELVDKLHDARTRSYLQHQHNIKDYRKFVDELNKPTPDEMLSESINTVLAEIPKVRDVKDALGLEVTAPKSEAREYFNNQYDQLNNQIESEYNQGEEGSGKKFKLQSLMFNKKEFSKEDIENFGKQIFKNKKFKIKDTKTKYQLSVLPKTKFEKKSFKSKKVGKGFNMKFGKVK